jgi:lysophospholipase L1-like esterase
MMWMDTAAKWHLDGGLVTDNLAVIKALTLAAATITTLSTSGLAVDSSQRGYVSGVEAVPILADTGGRVALALATDGRLVAPAGIVSPNSVQGITYAASRNRIDGVQAVSGPDLVGIGDSLTHGVGQTPYTTALAGLTGRDVANYGLGGQTSTEIAARFGASTTYLSVAGNTIPASGSVGVTVYDVDLLRTGAGASMAVTLYGVRGTLTRGAGTGVFAGAYTFTRATAGSAVTVPARVQIIPDTSALKERVAIIWIGNNNYAEDANIQRDILAIIRTLEAMKTRYLILTMLNGNYPGRRANDAPNTDYQTMMTINRNMMRLSNNVVDIQKLLPKDPLTDVVDAAYRVDDIHLNSAGYALVAGHIRDALTARGW